MSSNKDWSIGDILWQDLTITNAVEVRDFYRKVIGWEYFPEDLGGYEDYHMVPSPMGDSVAGICHARGDNADFPPVWMIYIAVEDVESSANLCEDLGGEVMIQPRNLGNGRFCVIRDPAGAICALYRPPEK